MAKFLSSRGKKEAVSQIQSDYKQTSNLRALWDCLARPIGNPGLFVPKEAPFGGHDGRMFSSNSPSRVVAAKID
jgi:RNAse (barnase) inhibitor barstar